MTARLEHLLAGDQGPAEGANEPAGFDFEVRECGEDAGRGCLVKPFDGEVAVRDGWLCHGLSFAASSGSRPEPGDHPEHPSMS